MASFLCTRCAYVSDDVWCAKKITTARALTQFLPSVQDDIANIELLACVRLDCSSRAALKEAGIETRREERNRNRLSNNRLRAVDVT